MTMDMQTYRDGRKQATDAAEAIRVALAGLGLPENVWGSVRPMVAHGGRPYVHLGMIRADARGNPDGVRRQRLWSADREEGPTPQRAQDDPRSQGRQLKGSRKPGLVAGASAGCPAQLAGYGHCPDPKGC